MQLTQKFDWSAELHKSMIHNLAINFGLDFLLFEDKKGGNVDTLHNARQDNWASNAEKERYRGRNHYNSHAYHSHSSYKQKGKQDKKLHQIGLLFDRYRNKKMGQSEVRHLDHTISAYEIHHDPARVLAEYDGILLANQDMNLNSTHWAINNAKKNHSMEKFINEIVPTSIKNRKNKLKNHEMQLKGVGNDTPKDRHKRRILEDKIQKDKEYINSLESIDKKAMLKADKEARKTYNQELSLAYYGSSKFLNQAGSQAIHQGIQMGSRQVIGLILAEIWFELREAVPSIINKCKANFKLEVCWQEFKNTTKNIFERVKLRFEDIINNFKDNFIGGILSSITTTIMNIFLTSAKLVTRLIREIWSSLIQVIKLIFFNPNKLNTSDLMKETSRLLLTGISTAFGIILNQQLSSTLTIPFGAEISAFISALFTGILTVGVVYFIDYSPMTQKIWYFLNNLKNKYDVFLDHIKEINAELDRYLAELARIEFNLNPQEFLVLSDALSATSNEYERGKTLKQETDKER